MLRAMVQRRGEYFPHNPAKRGITPSTGSTRPTIARAAAAPTGMSDASRPNAASAARRCRSPTWNIAGAAATPAGAPFPPARADLAARRLPAAGRGSPRWIRPCNDRNFMPCSGAVRAREITGASWPSWTALARCRADGFCTLFTAAPAAAQPPGPPSSSDRSTGRRSSRPAPEPPEFRVPEGDLRRAGEPPRNGLIRRAGEPQPPDRHRPLPRRRHARANPTPSMTAPGRHRPAPAEHRRCGFSLRFDWDGLMVMPPDVLQRAGIQTRIILLFVRTGPGLRRGDDYSA